MAKYFDNREQREKTLPDCARHGLQWDEQTQRCERRGIVIFNEDYNSAIDYPAYGGDLIFEGEHTGLGFLPGPAIAPLVGAGPVGWIAAGVATAASLLWSIFGGGDDQATTYRAPGDAASRFVSFDDEYGQEQISYDMGSETQRITAANGNRWDDVSSYYSAFTSNSTRSGASEAARRVIEDVARQRGVSISRAADLVLQAAGAIRIVQSFLPGPGAQSGSPTGLPGYWWQPMCCYIS